MLLPGQVHLWRAAVDNLSGWDACSAVLSYGERLRADNFAFARDRQHYVISHGALRIILERYTFVAAAALEFEAAEFGKPRLAHQFTDVRFSLSHTDGMALIAITSGHEVGVDVERIDERLAYEDIADYFFQPSELWELRIAPRGERVRRFFEVWTQKEAYLKATGRGLAGLDDCNESRFAARAVRPAEGYAGAVASEGNDWQLACWEWSL